MIQHCHIFNSLLLKESRLKFKNQVSSCTFAFTLLGFFALSDLPQKETKVEWVYPTYTELLWWTFAGPWTFWRLETLMPILSRSSSIKDWTLLYRTSLYYIGLHLLYRTALYYIGPNLEQEKKKNVSPKSFWRKIWWGKNTKYKKFEIARRRTIFFL